MRSFCSLDPTKPLSVEVPLSLAAWKAFHLVQAAGDVDWVSTLPFPVARGREAMFYGLSGCGKAPCRAALDKGGYLAWMLACTEEIRRNHRAVVRSRLGGAASRGKHNLSGAFSGSDVALSHSRVNG